MASITERLKVIFGVEGADKFKRDFKDAEKSVGGFEKAATGAFKKIGAAAAAYLTLQAAKALGRVTVELAKLADQSRVVGASFDRLAKSIGQNSNQILASMKRGLGGAVSELEMMRQANQAILLGIPVTASEMENLGRVAVRLGRAVGRDAASALGDLVTGIGRMSPLILDNLGITIKAENAFRGLGEGATDAEKRLAFFNAVMAKANERAATLGNQAPTLTEKIGKLDAAWENFATSLGKLVMPAVASTIKSLTDLINVANRANKALEGTQNSLRQQRIDAGIIPDPNAPPFTLDEDNFALAPGASPELKKSRAKEENRMRQKQAIAMGIEGGAFPIDNVTPKARLGGGTRKIRAGGEFRQSTAAEDTQKMVDDNVQEWKEAWGKLGEVGRKELASIPEAMGDEFNTVMGRLETQMAALGLRGRGIFGGLAGIQAGLTSSGMVNQANPQLQRITKALESVVPFGQLITGALDTFKGIKSLVGGMLSGGNIDLATLTDQQTQALARGDFEDAFDNKMLTNLLERDPQVARQLQDSAKQRLEGAGRTSGSQAFTAVQTITEVTGNAIHATLDTSRAIQAQHLEVATAHLASSRNIEFLMSVNTATMFTFVGR